MRCSSISCHTSSHFPTQPIVPSHLPYTPLLKPHFIPCPSASPSPPVSTTGLSGSLNSMSGVSTRMMERFRRRNASLTCLGWTRSSQWSRAMASDRRMRLSSCRTVTRHADLETPKRTPPILHMHTLSHIPASPHKNACTHIHLLTNQFQIETREQNTVIHTYYTHRTTYHTQSHHHTITSHHHTMTHAPTQGSGVNI